MQANEIFKDIVAPSVHISEAQTAIYGWLSWYVGYVQKFHQYQIYNGRQKVNKRMLTLNMAKKVSEDWADLLFNEKVMITVDNAETNEKLAEVLKMLNFQTIVNKGVEKAFALGTVGYVISVNEKNQISLENVEAYKVYPITIENGRVVECGFLASVMKQGKKYAYVSIHKRNDEGLYQIENALYEMTGDSDEISGTPNEHWVYFTGSSIPWFSIFSPNAVNNLNLNSAFGISVFANSLNVLKSVDKSYDSLMNEAEIGRMRIIVATEATSFEDGEAMPTFDPMDTAFQRIPKGINEPNMIETIAPQLRTKELIDAINAHLALLSAECGFGTGYYYLDQKGQLKTATEVISDNSPLYRRMKKHEIPLRETVTTIVAAIIDVYSRVNKIPMPYEKIVIQFDDSIIQDTEAERAQDAKDVNLGVMSLIEYREKWYGEDEETARAAIEAAQAERNERAYVER